MIQDLIAACEWGTNPFLFFSENVFSPLIYYSHLTPVLVSLIFGIFVYLSNRKSLLNRSLLFVSLMMSIWLLLDLILWATDSPKVVMFVWALVNAFEPVIYAGFVYLTYAFITEKDVSWKVKAWLVIPLIPTILSMSTVWNVAAFNLSNCDREVIEGPMAFYNYLIEIGYAVWISVLGIWAWMRQTDIQRKRQSTFVVLVTLFLLLGFSSGNILGSFTEDWALGQYGLFVIPAAIGALSYFIVQFRFFAKSQLMAAQMLVIGLWLATASILFIQSIEYARWVVGVTLVFLAVIGYILVQSLRREIEQRKEIEEQRAKLEIANDRLKELDQLKSEFLSIASHQLRAPITAVRGYAANIVEGEYGPVPENLKEPLATVQETARLMVNSIEDYLNISRIEQGRMKYEKSDFDIADIAKKVATELGPLATKKNLSLATDIPEDLMVNADIGKIKQVITNLLDNSIKYTEQGSVTVKVERKETLARVTILDTGIGISAEEIGGLFEKFKRARGANKVNTTGTGLGLYVAKQLVEGNGGKIWIESDGAGKGSRFIFELPALPA